MRAQSWAQTAIAQPAKAGEAVVGVAEVQALYTQMEELAQLVQRPV